MRLNLHLRITRLLEFVIERKLGEKRIQWKTEQVMETGSVGLH